jgi:hypothetical protein
MSIFYLELLIKTHKKNLRGVNDSKKNNY